MEVYGEDVGLEGYAADDAVALIDALAANIPGVPGEDYPIYAGFTCKG